jgi:hypothetical protein
MKLLKMKGYFMSENESVKQSVPFGWDAIEAGKDTSAAVPGLYENPTELGSVFVSPSAFEALKQELTHLQTLEPEVDVDDCEPDLGILNEK